ncbi:hypothetical protein C8Q79DRAFT_914610, partial [Trametes meyenii]
PQYLGGRTPSGCPKASDYEPHIHKLIMRACHHFEVLIATEDAFPDRALRGQWAMRVWLEVCATHGTSYTLTDRVESIITSRDSHAHGALRDKIKSKIAHAYGFRTEATERAKAYNLSRHTYLLDCESPKPEPHFHYKDVDERAHFAHNQVMLDALHEHWFPNPAGLGIQYISYFAPVRKETLALVFTTIEFCLDQWADGVLNPKLTFTEKIYKPRYALHLKHLKNWTGLNTEAAHAVRQQMHDRARRASGAAPIIAPIHGLSATSEDRLRIELAAQAAAAMAGDDNSDLDVFDS